MLPDFIVLGAARSGSTWIFKNLEKHPQVFVPRQKEIHFFNRHYDRGLAYYESFFENAPPGAKIGEVSPEYLHDAEVAAPRIKAHLPNAKLIACLRNPVDRLYSKYWNARGRFAHRKDLPFERKLQEQPGLLKEGCYIDHLSTYLRHFDREQMLILLYDDLKADPRRFLSSIYSFIGVDPSFVPPLVDHRINAAATQPLTVKHRWLFWGAKVLRRLDLHSPARWIERRNSGVIPPMPPSIRRHLTDTYYRDKNRELEALIGRDLSHWNA
ncbi:MAG TPA: sulfotransferase domain-containing protein [Gammaproteobacteria bacterium]